MNQALANLAGLDGLFGLNLDCESALTSEALARSRVFRISGGSDAAAAGSMTTP